MGKAEAEEHNEITPTEVAEIAAPNAQFPEDKAVNEDGVNDVKGECDRGLDLQDDPPDDRDGYHVCDHPPDADGDVKEHSSNPEVNNSMSDEDKSCIAEEQNLEIDDWFDSTEDVGHDDHLATAPGDKGDGADNIP